MRFIAEILETRRGRSVGRNRVKAVPMAVGSKGVLAGNVAGAFFRFWAAVFGAAVARGFGVGSARDGFDGATVSWAFVREVFAAADATLMAEVAT